MTSKESALGVDSTEGFAEGFGMSIVYRHPFAVIIISHHNTDGSHVLILDT